MLSIVLNNIFLILLILQILIIVFVHKRQCFHHKEKTLMNDLSGFEMIATRDLAPCL